MQNILPILQEYTRSIVATGTVALQNIEASRTEADELGNAFEAQRTSHREWSNFTGEAGRE